jgi:hypothetical protein
VSGRRIFDEVVRTDPEPSRGEDSFTFLNRVASPYWERVRTFVDDAFSAYPAAHAPDLRSRFRDRRWPVHVGAWWELYLFTLFRALGLRADVHPELASVDSPPDFQLWVDSQQVLVEARYVTAGLVADDRTVGRDDLDHWAACHALASQLHGSRPDYSARIVAAAAGARQQGRA